MSSVITCAEKQILDKKGYRLIRKLGEGSFAKVYLGQFQSNDGEDQYKLACKIIDTRRTPKEYKRKFLCREINILANCIHPHIVAVHSIFMKHDKFFIFMRFAERGDLYEIIQAYGAVAEQQACIWIRQMALALEYLHVLDIAHRDLKVENILVTENYNVKLTDFGFSRSCVNENGESAWSETWCGSLAYVSPEVLKCNPYRPKVADMWSFGVVIYTMLNKGNPFNATDMASLYRQQMNREWKFRQFVESKISDGMKLLVSNLLEPDVVKRLKVTCVLRNPLMDVPSVSSALLHAEQEALRNAYMHKQRCKLKKNVIIPMTSHNNLDETHGESISEAKTMTLIRPTVGGSEICESDIQMTNDSANLNSNEFTVTTNPIDTETQAISMNAVEVTT